MASYKKSRDQLQLGLVQAVIMIIMHFIHPSADWQLQIQRHSAGPAVNFINQITIGKTASNLWMGTYIPEVIDKNWADGANPVNIQQYYASRLSNDLIKTVYIPT